MLGARLDGEDMTCSHRSSGRRPARASPPGRLRTPWPLRLRCQGYEAGGSTVTSPPRLALLDRREVLWGRQGLSRTPNGATHLLMLNEGQAATVSVRTERGPTQSRFVTQAPGNDPTLSHSALQARKIAHQTTDPPLGATCGSSTAENTTPQRCITRSVSSNQTYPHASWRCSISIASADRYSLDVDPEEGLRGDTSGNDLEPLLD